MRLRNLIEMVRIQVPNTPDGVIVFQLNSALQQFCEETRIYRKESDLLAIYWVNEQGSIVLDATSGNSILYSPGEMGVFEIPPDCLQVRDIFFADADGRIVSLDGRYSWELVTGNTQVALTLNNTVVDSVPTGVTSVMMKYIARPPVLDSAQVDMPLVLDDTFGMALYHKAVEFFQGGQNKYHSGEYHRLKQRAIRQANNEKTYGRYNIVPGTF